MAATIWKFQIPIEPEFSIEMPRDAEPLFVEVQGEQTCLWARVVPERSKEIRKFKLRGTGQVVDMDCEHVGSFMLHGGMLVFHLFDPEPRSRS